MDDEDEVVCLYCGDTVEDGADCEPDADGYCIECGEKIADVGDT